MSISARRARTRLFMMAALTGAVAFFGSAAIVVAQDDDDGLSFEQKIITNMLQGFGVDTGRDRINYRERSPLVIPPSRDLPPPEDVAVANNPAWPKDPDVKQRKKSSDKPQVKTITQLEDPGRALRPNELEQGRGAGAGRVTRPGEGSSSTEDSGKPLKPSELGYAGGIWNTLFGYTKEELGTFSGEPPRTSLTQPPSGYLTPSAAQPYGVNTKKNTSTLEMPQVKDPRTAAN